MTTTLRRTRTRKTKPAHLPTVCLRSRRISLKKPVPPIAFTTSFAIAVPVLLLIPDAETALNAEFIRFKRKPDIRFGLLCAQMG